MDSDRRAFLKKMSLASVGLATLGDSYAFPQDRKLNVAMVGLGNYAGIMADGITSSKYCKVAALVTGTPSKEKTWGDKYHVPNKNIYNYDTFDRIADNPDIDLVYVTLPNAMHREFAVRAARAKKHVIVEKPMAISVQECKDIIEACEKNKVQLAVGYRLHFEPYNMEMMRLGQQKVFGQVRLVDASLGYKVSMDPKDWHVIKKLSGGGPLTNLGVYCVQASRYIIGEEPIAVTAQFGPITNPQAFKEVEESITWQLTFPSGATGTCTTSYSYGIDRLYAAADEGFFELSPAISYGPFRGRTRQGDFTFPTINQQQTQMDALAKFFLSNTSVPNHISGYEGLKDLKVIEAIYKAAASGRKENI
jgi:predicted dehydrogenase